jgi:hypothetical protein
MLQTSKPIRRTKYPAPSFFDPASITTRFYGHKLVGHCLDPVFKDGDMVVFDSEAELENGCFAVCYYRPELVKLGHHSALLKRLVFAPSKWVKFPWRDHPKAEIIPIIIVEQFNPRQQVLAIHRCLGSANDPEVRATLEAEGWQI